MEEAVGVGHGCILCCWVVRRILCLEGRIVALSLRARLG
jgi:hypothetical protein